MNTYGINYSLVNSVCNRYFIEFIKSVNSFVSLENSWKVWKLKTEKVIVQIYLRRWSWKYLFFRYTATLHSNGPLTRYVTLRVAHAPVMPGTFSQPPRVSDPDMHHGTCVTHVPWCMPGSLSSGFLWRRWGGHSRRMRNTLFHISGKRPVELAFATVTPLSQHGSPWKPTLQSTYQRQKYNINQTYKLHHTYWPPVEPWISFWRLLAKRHLINKNYITASHIDICLIFGTIKSIWIFIWM